MTGGPGGLRGSSRSSQAVTAGRARAGTRGCEARGGKASSRGREDGSERGILNFPGGPSRPGPGLPWGPASSGKLPGKASAQSHRPQGLTDCRPQTLPTPYPGRVCTTPAETRGPRTALTCGQGGGPCARRSTSAPQTMQGADGAAVQAPGRPRRLRVWPEQRLPGVEFLTLLCGRIRFGLLL